MMRLLPFPRRHRALWLIAAVLGIAAWGAWLVSTGRTTDYSSGYSHTSAPESVPQSGSHESRVPDAAGLLVTLSSVAPHPTAAAGAAAARNRGQLSGFATPERTTSSATSPVAVSSPASLVGMTDSLAFARTVATILLTYAPTTDLTARTDAVMAVAALPPIGAPAELAADVRQFDPDPVTRYGDGTVTFAAGSVAPSPWAEGRLDRLGLPTGSFAIDVTGSQLLALPGHAPVSVSVTFGITGACPPALSQCEIDRIFPRTVAQELGS
jgi:hypothetical protein